jgi:RNA polymerase sigma-70 factor, ECF subfamily
MREITFAELEQLQPRTDEADDALQMDQDSFSGLYERTARPLWVYLCRKTGDAQIADDLLQETYYRFLRARIVFESDSHRKNYLFRVATNLVNDNYRRSKDVQLSDEFESFVAGDSGSTASEHQRRSDLARAMSKLRPRERDALWLAYAEGLSHREVAVALGVKITSMKVLLFRARQRLASLLRGKR